MDISRKQKLFLIGGPLIIGALGSALWDFAKPVVLWVGSVMFYLTTLGFGSIQDGMYEEIARGSYERAAERLLVFFLSFGCGAFIGASVAVFLPKRTRKMPGEESDPSTTHSPDLKVESVGDGNKGGVRRLSKLRLVAITLALSASVTFGFQAFRLTYIIRAANNMEQLQRIAAPYISEEQRLLIASKFSSMSTRDEYLELRDQLGEIIRSNGARVPDFYVY